MPVEQQGLKEEVFERAVCYALDARGTQFIHGKVIRELIKCWNPDWDTEKFAYKKNGNSLKLSGPNLTTLRSKEVYSSHSSFLRFLRIDSLDISGSGIKSLSNIDGLTIKSIDIRDTEIRNLHPHSATKALDVVYLNPGQFDPDSDSIIPKSIKLIYNKD